MYVDNFFVITKKIFYLAEFFFFFFKLSPLVRLKSGFQYIIKALKGDLQKINKTYKK